MPARLTPPTLARSLGRCLSGRSASAAAAPQRTAASAGLVAPCPCPFSSPAPQRRSFHASTAAAAVPLGMELKLPTDYVPPTQPPSAKRPEMRKTQLLRQYTSLLRTSPLVLLFQQNNLTGAEWTALRRELVLALRKVSAEQKAALGIAWPDNFADNIRIQVIRTRIFDLALRMTEFYDPAAVTAEQSAAATRGRGKKGAIYNHDVSPAASEAMKQAVASGRTASPDSAYAQLKPLLVGPLMVVTFPDISPAHLAAALSILAPSPATFPPPTRKKSPGYYELDVQGALPKLLLVGGRVEGQAFDSAGLQWVGKIEGGRQGLQAQLLHMLQSAGLGLTAALEGASKSLWLTMESRKVQLEDAKPKDAPETSVDAVDAPVDAPAEETK